MQLTVNHEFDMFEARVDQLADVVDVLLLTESNYTASGIPKEYKFLKKFTEGWLSKRQDKIAYVPMSTFPERAKRDGWFADSRSRDSCGPGGHEACQQCQG